MELLQDDVILREQPHCELVAAPTVKPGSVPGEAGGSKEQRIQFSLFFKSSLQGDPSLSAGEKECHPHSYREVLELTAIPPFTGLPPCNPLSLDLAYSLLKNYNSQRIKI